MIRNQMCIYDKAPEIINYIKDIAKDFDFSEFGADLSEQQKYLIIKNLYGLYLQCAISDAQRECRE